MSSIKKKKKWLTQIFLPWSIVCLILNSTANSQPTSPTSSLKPPAPILFPCLTRAEKERIEIAFEENDACHAALAATTAPQPEPTSSWRKDALWILGGLAAGLYIGSRIR